MKIKEINLKAFGAFSDATIDLAGSNSGLQIVYGPNEAGKSTAMRAVYTSLFGFAHQSNDSARHSKPMVGATIESDGQTLSFLRRKGRKNTLLNPETNAALPDGTLKPFLGSVDAETFARVFSINVDELERGGEEMRQLRGLVGESLFAASLGGVGLTRLISELDEDASKIYAPRKRKHMIRMARDEYDAALKEKKEASVPFSKWQQLQKELKQTQDDRESTIAALNDLRIHERRLNRIRQSLELLTRRKQLALDLAEFGKVTPLPPDYSIQERNRIEGELAQLKPQIEALTQELEGEEGLRAKISQVVVDDALLALEFEIEELQERAGACQKALRDRDITLQTKRNEITLHAERILKELKLNRTLEEIDDLRVTPEQRIEVQNLGNEEKQVNSKPAEIAAEIDRLKTVIREHHDQVAELADSKDLSTLEKSCRLARKHDSLDEEIETLQSDYENQRKNIASKIGSLGLWSGSVDEFSKFSAPLPETVNRFIDVFSELSASEKKLNEGVQQIQNEASQIEEAISTLKKTANVPTEQDLIQSRETRDKTWQTIRNVWLDDLSATKEKPATLAVEFSQQVANADDIADRLRREAERVERLAQLLSRAESLRSQQDAKSEDLQRLQQKQLESKAEWANLWKPCGIESPLPPIEMRAWLVRHDEIRVLIDRSNETADRLDRMQRTINDVKKQLTQQAASFGEDFAADATIVDMLDFLEGRVEQEQTNRVRKERLIRETKKLESELHVATRQLADADRVKEQWMTKWCQLMDKIGCSSDTSAAQANERLHQLGRLFEYANQIQDIEVRVEGINVEVSEFESSVTFLSEKLKKPVETSLFEFVISLRHALNSARTDKTRFESIQLSIEETELRLSDANTKRRELTARMSKLCRIADADSSDQLPEIEDRSRRFAECREKLEQVEDQLIHIGGGLSIDDLVAEAEGKNGDQLTAELATIEVDITAKEAERDEIVARLRALESQSNTNDSESRSVSADQRALGILSRMQTDASRFIRLRVASVVLRQMIDRHRAENEDPLLAKASDLFSQITCGQFVGLRNDYENDEAVIKGLRHNEELVAVDEMSSGTRDQMYLALRLGYLQRRLAEQNSLPVIVDDILVNFDDQRAGATLQVLAELAQMTQIILFTHHQRIVEIAKADLNQEACFVHQLPARRIAV